MFRKLLSKITQTLKGGTKRTESARPAPPPKTNRAGGRDHRPRHEKKAPRTDAPKAAPSTPRAAPAAPGAHAPKLLPAVPKLDTSCPALGLGDRIAYAVQQKGYENPTPIQAQAIPVVLSGKDVIGSAQTGTGKTAAFSLPILQKLGTHGAGLRCLVLEPTRELALQVEESFKEYSKFTDLRTTVI